MILQFTLYTVIAVNYVSKIIHYTNHMIKMNIMKRIYVILHVIRHYLIRWKIISCPFVTDSVIPSINACVTETLSQIVSLSFPY